MESLMGLINLEHEHDFLNELTQTRCPAAVPFAGRYRMIDFTLSNMTKSNINEIAVFTKHKYRSLMHHLGSGVDWELNKRHGGLYILPPQENNQSDMSKGDLKHFCNNWDYFERNKSDHVLISGTSFISNMNYQELFQHHLDTNADVTLLTTTYNLSTEHEHCLKVDTATNGTVTAITSDKNNPHVFSGIYIIKKSLLAELVEKCIATYKEHFFIDGIIANLHRLNIQSYQYNGYSFMIHSVDSYYKNSLALLEMNNYKQLFPVGEKIYTKISNHAPAKYNTTSNVSKSFIATGGVIDGAVKNSLLFRGVKVQKGAVVKNAIILDDCTIEENAHVENIIIDKEVTVSKNQFLKGSEKQPFIVAKQKTV
ncbi:glucose-1-phosphate adenylyltransferase subunit GlgD [Gracilibacillus sp. YIM 98692]|uniref:glucose-1-phosphate adenylyltransferase subunit GlgD n=1 Tax=Gracilibacillus sp. YIM 98692 TaxID=2663532 RepID=UPI0013D5D294|nr:glucose-1-phosphate adenylyltransferase subunit GlgD [Gracilibacillus sp. YIM 98692]